MPVEIPGNAICQPRPQVVHAGGHDEHIHGGPADRLIFTIPQLGRALNANEKVVRRAWTQGTPPAYGFERGHVFHAPPECHLTSAVPQRTLVVLLAKADAGALIQKVIFDENGDESTETTSDDAAHTGGGWVDYELFDYDADGLAVSQEKSTLTQARFARLLRTGE